LLKEHMTKGAIIAGNSVHHDMRFIRREMPRLDDFLSYRIVDVSSFKEVVRRWFPDLPRHKKPPNHKALEDIRGSISELKYYRDSIMKS
ncbi:MAG: exonuclease domain-containing protein, partial [Candidatus Thalassarchaeaceae archaeon]